MASLIDQFIRAEHNYWRLDNPTYLGALFCILQADIRAFGPAAKILSYEHKGKLPLSVVEWADAIDGAYLSGF